MFKRTLMLCCALIALIMADASSDITVRRSADLTDAEAIVEELKQDCVEALQATRSGSGADPLLDNAPLESAGLPGGCLAPPRKTAKSRSSADAASDPNACEDRAPDIEATWEGPPRWMSGNPISGGETFFGSLGKGISWTIGSSVTNTQYVDVEIRFSADTTTLCQVYRVEQGFAPVGVGTFPGSAWDVSDPGNPRRLNICFAEWDDFGGPVPPPNMVWDPDTSTGPPVFGKWEFLYIMRSTYDGTGLTYAGTNIFTQDLDVLYAWYPRVEPGHTLLEAVPATLRIHVFDEFVTDTRAMPDDGEIAISWTYCGLGAQTGFRIMQGTTSPPTVERAVVGPGVRNFLDTGLINDILYYYQVMILGPGDEILGWSPVFFGVPQKIRENMNLVSTWNGDGNYGDCWGYVDPGTNREYALIAARNSGAYIIDIDQTPPVQVAFIPSQGGDPKDIKIYKNFAILLNESGPIQIHDISTISNPTWVVNIWPDGNGSHNCMVDGDYLYVVGNWGVGGLQIFDLSLLPLPIISLVGQYQVYYYHDIAIHNDTLYGAAIYGDGVDIIDVTNKAAPVFLDNFNYPGSGSHNAAVSEDGRYAFIGDEIGTSGNHVRVFDVSTIGNVNKVFDILIKPGTIVHNCYVLGDLLYIAHYGLGVRIWNIVDPAAPYEVGFYDTHPEGDFGMDGAWNVYPFLPSGRVIASDMLNGLFVLEFTGEVPSCDCSCHGDPECDGEANVFDVVRTVSEAFRAEPPLTDATCTHYSRSDTDCSCSVDVFDVVRIVDRAFRNNPAPFCDPCIVPCP